MAGNWYDDKDASTLFDDYADMPGYEKVVDQYPQRTQKDVYDALRQGGNFKNGVVVMPLNGNDGAYFRNTDMIGVDPRVLGRPDRLRTVVGHEPGHAQYIPKDFDYTAYEQAMKKRAEAAYIDTSSQGYKDDLYFAKPEEQWAEAYRVASELVQEQPWISSMRSNSRGTEVVNQIDKLIGQKIQGERTALSTPVGQRSDWNWTQEDQAHFRDLVYRALYQVVRGIRQYGSPLALAPQEQQAINQTLIDQGRYG